MKKINLRRLKRNLRKKKTTIITLSTVIIAFLFVCLTLTHENNFIEVAYTKVLNSAGIYTKEVKSIEFDSGNYDEEGSWKITKSADWTSGTTAQIKFDLDTVMKPSNSNYKDVIFVIDISGSMKDSKLSTLINESEELINYLLSDENNRVALITFESTSSVISGFTNDKDAIIDSINSLSTTGWTNYNAAYKNIGKVMENYTEEPNRDVITLFLTDGYPNIDTPNQVGTYESLKDSYPYMTIDGIQYELGTSLIDEIVEITDNQWLADQESLYNVLFEAVLSPVKYNSFTVTDFIDTDYFNVSSASDITVSRGTISFNKDNQKITWNLGENTYWAGLKATMKINVTVNSSVSDNDVFIPTNKSESVTYKLPDENEKTINSTSTPVLKLSYNVLYDSNAPDGCSVSDNSTESHKMFSTVTKKSTELSCDGYLFNGWSIDDDSLKDITMVNEDSFIMPTHDVTIRGTWTKQSLKLSVDGSVHEKTTLYKVLEQEAKTGKYAKTFTGSHQDSISNNGTDDIYYYTSSSASNNVIFAGQCWDMYRTTDTGGVKLIYNGEPVNNQCLSTRSDQNRYYGHDIISLDYGYYYGTSYTTDKYGYKTLSGNLTRATWSDSTYNDLIGKYTCLRTWSSSSCSTLYYVDKYYNSTKAYVSTIDSSYYDTIKNTSTYNYKSFSPASVGYKYYDEYEFSNFPLAISYYDIPINGSRFWIDEYYSDEVKYDSSTGKYTLEYPETLPELIIDSSSEDEESIATLDSSFDYSNLKGHYTFQSSDSSYKSSTVYYIIDAIDKDQYYYIELSDGKSIDDYTVTFGNSYIDNGDGTYTLGDTTTVKYVDWYSNYSNYNFKYTCGDDSLTCSNIILVKYFYDTGYDGYYKSKYRYGSSVKWDGSKYTLVDPIEIDPLNFKSSDLSSHHYTCLGDGTSCTSVKYIYYISSDKVTGTGYYITLTDGMINPTDALNNMLTKNTTDSYIKSEIDAWYEYYLLDYSDYIEEDTIFCNNRSISSYGGWNPNGGSLLSSLVFNSYSSSNLSCTNETDKFSVTNPVAVLKYPIGLITYPEYKLSHSSINEYSRFYTSSPYSFSSSSNMYVGNSYSSYGIRPVIVLKDGIEYSSGNGSETNPYVIETN